MHNYSSYLIRHWLVGKDSSEHRNVFDIEHVQSGRRTRLTSLSAAELWLEAVTSETQSQTEASEQAEDK